MIRLFGGGGGLPPGVAGDGLTPGGLVLAGQLRSFPSAPNPIVLGNSGPGATGPTYVNADSMSLGGDFDTPSMFLLTVSGQTQRIIGAFDASFNLIFALGPTGMIGEAGKDPPVAPASITGNVTTGTLANLQAVVGQLLTALDAKGTITKSTT